MKQALPELVGGPCHHMLEVQHRLEVADTWIDAYEGTLPDWVDLFAGYRATVDWPSAPFWPELSRAFPDALILLSVRDADSWWESASETIFPVLAQFCAPDAPRHGAAGMGRAMMTSFSPDWQNEDAAKSAFEAYNQHVRTTAPADRLLEWRATDGWGPICAALDVPVPDRAFPHANSRDEVRAAFRAGAARTRGLAQLPAARRVTVAAGEVGRSSTMRVSSSSTTCAMGNTLSTP